MNKKILAGKRSVLIKINNFILIILLASLLLLLPKILAFNLTNLNSEEDNSLILLKLEYKNGSSYDMDNNGIETLGGIIDFTVKNTIFNLNVNESNLCTRWNIYSIENETSVTACYGSKKCCNFIGLEPSMAGWNEMFYLYYGRYGATANNKISAQITYVDYSLNPENPYSNIHYSSWSSLSAIFKKETKLYTKIINFVNDRLSIVRGAVMKITAVLSYVNDSPIPHENINLYLNNSLVDTRTTDIFGNVAFEFNTTVLSPHDYIFNISFPGKTIQSPQETIKIMPSFNLSFVKILPTENENLDVAENLVQLSAEIGRPVEWVKEIEIKNTENDTRELNISFKVPEEATNIIVEKDGVEIKETAEKTEFSKSSFGINSISTEPCFELKEIKNKEKIFEINDEITQTETGYKIMYETEAPKKEEINFDDKNKIKQILVYSNVSFHYYNISAFTEIPESIINPRLYHIINSTRTDVTDKKEYDVKFLDTDNNGLYDRIEWIVPQLSEQLFEIGLATINTKKSIYHPGETAQIIMVVLDKNGYLVSDAYVSLEVSNPDNQKEYYSTPSGTITETEKGIYEVSYFDTSLEGNYSLVVTAIGGDVNNIMASYFTVKDYYEFDILRNTPATTDPWQDVFTSEIRIISFTNATKFDFSEFLPSDFNITCNNGAEVTKENNKNVLTWTNLTNNSVVSYSAKPPLVTPELYEIGPAYISYDSQTFTEARPWYLAVDPINTYYGANSSSYSSYCYDNTIGLLSSTQSDDGTYYQMGRLSSNTAALDWTTADKAFLDIHVQGEKALMTQIDINWDGYCTISKGAPSSLYLAWYDWDSDTYTNFNNNDFGCGGAEPATNPSVSIGSSYIDDALNGSQYLRIAFAAYGGNKACDDGTDIYHDQIYITVTTLDDLFPQWYNNKSNIVQTYSPTKKSYFNISWSDTIGVSTVWLESNYSSSKNNYSMTRLSGDANSGLYNYSAILPAGTYYWKSYANDTENQWNQTDNWTFIIARASPGITLTLNETHGNVSMNEDNYIWINGTKTSPDSQNLKLYKNETLINDNPSPISNYTLFDKPGYYNITLIYEQNINYSYESKTYFVNVSDAIAPNVTLTAPKNNSYTKNINVSFYYDVSDYSDIANCTINISSRQEKYVNQSPVDKSGTNNFTINNVEQTTIYWFVECTDYSQGKLTGQSETRMLKVDATSPTLDYIIPPTPKNNSFKNTSTIIVNVTHTENNPANPDTIQFLINGTINQTNGYEGGDSKFTNFTIILNDGTYNFNVFINDSAGNNNTLANRTVIVDTISPLIDYDETNPENNTNQTQNSFIVNVTHTENNPDTIILYLNESINQSRPYSGSFTNFSMDNFNDGAYSYYVWLNDSAGNTNKTDSRIINIDSTPPSLFLEFPENDTWSTNSNVVFKYNATDNLMEVDNCSLIINNKLNETNYTITEGVSQNFTVSLGNSPGYDWSINCSDKLNNINDSETRVIKLDTTFPTISNEGINDTNFTVNQYICLNVSVTDTFSNVKNVSATIDFPDSGLENFTFSNESGGCGNAGGNVWSKEVRLTKQGEYNWTKTYAEDYAGNINETMPLELKNWSAVSQVFLNVTMKEPSADLELNESTSLINNSYLQVCNVTCRQDSTEDCEDVVLYAQYYDSGWKKITTGTTKLINNLDNRSCGTLNTSEYCNQTFNITIGTTAGWNTFEIKCYAESSNAGVWDSDAVNLTVNDFPVAAFTYPQNGSYLNGIKILNGSASTDDQNIINYVFELDNNTNFDSPTILCDSVYANCTFNTINQIQCSENSFECYLRLNVTDSDGLKNSTYITIQIDNNNPFVNLDEPFDNSWDNDGSIDFKYTPYDTNIDSCVLYHNDSSWQANETNNNQANGVQDTFATSLDDGNYVWNVWCNDSAGNYAFNATNYTINVDTTYPLIDFADDTEKNDTYFNRNWIYVNVSITDDNKNETIFYLYNSSLDLVNNYSVSSSYPTNPPASCSGDWIQCDGTYADGGSAAVGDSDQLEMQIYNFSFSVPLGSTIGGIEVIHDSWETDAIGSLNISLSWDGGTSWTDEKSRPLTSSETTYTEGSSTDTWGRAWTSTEINSNTNFRVKFETVDNGNEWDVDYVRIRVYYSLTSINFTNLNQNMVYYYNATHIDKAGNPNSTETRKITLDSTYPLIEFAEDTEENDTYFNRDWIYVNVSITDDNKNETMFYLYNSSLDLVDNISRTDGTSYVNFTGLTDTNEIYYYNITHIDKAGFENSTETRKITLDDTNPVVNLNEPFNETLTINNNIAFNYTPSDTNLKNCSLYGNFSGRWQLNQTDASPTNGIKNSFNPIIISDGNYIWNAECYDEAGNNAFNNTNYTLEIDTSSPTQFNLIFPANNTYSTNRTPLLNWTETLEPNFDNYTIIFDDNINFNSINHNYTLIGNASNTSYQIQPGEQLDDNTLFYWKVLAYDNLSHNRNSTEVFIYATDNSYPVINLENPENDTEVTDSFIVTFYYNVSDNFNVNNCSLIINDGIKGTDTTVDMNTSQQFPYNFANGQYNWSINCTDEAGNENQSETRNLSINVAIPEVRFYETAVGTVSETSVQYINLSTSNEANADRVTINPGPGSTGLFTFDVATFGDNNQIGPNGLLIPASTSITFDGNFQCGTANAGYARWKLQYNNGSGYTDICTAQTSSYVSTIESNMNALCTSPNYQIYLDTDDTLRVYVYFNKIDSKNFGFYHDWDQPDNSGFDIYAYMLGNLVVNLSLPTGTYTVNESDSFNATCNVSCSDGWCYNTQVYIQQNTSSSTWSNIDDVTGNLIYVGGSNPQNIGHINSTQLVNFTLKGNQISKDANIRCIATSDYSNANGSVTTNIIVNDYTPPTIELNNPQNDSWDNDGNIIFYYTPNDNYNVSDCSLIINGTINQTNHTITKAMQNNFTLNNLNDVIYEWNISCTDSFDNTNSSDTWIINIDTIFPKIEFADNTEDNDTYFNRDWIYVNVSIAEENMNETIFYLYNSTFDLLSNISYTNETTFVTFGNLADSNISYYYNVTHIDKAGNKNFTETRKITMDDTNPQVEFADDTEKNDTYFNRDWIYVNVSINDGNKNETIFYLYNSTLDLISNISRTGGITYVNFTGLTETNEIYYYNATHIDKAGNNGSSETRMITLDDINPQVEFADDTEKNDTYFNRDWIYMNVSVVEENKNETRFYLYNSNLNLINNTNYTSGITYINFTSLDLNMVYYYNATHIDKAGNPNSTETRKITMDDTDPQVEFADDTENNDTYFNRNWIYVNVSITDGNKNETMFYLYNSTLDLISNISRTGGITYVNFTGLIDTNEIYYYNATHTDKAGNNGSSETRKITLDNINPQVEFADDTENNDTYFNRNWVYVNVSVVEENKNETIFYLYNSSLDLVNNYSLNSYPTNPPASCSGDLIQCGGTYADGESVAVGDSEGLEMQLYNFGFSIPSTTIKGIEVVHDSWETDAIGSLNISLSWDGGISWTAEKSRALSNSETTYTEGSSTDTWGQTWTSTEINTNFRVKFETVGNGNEWGVDYVRIKIYHSTTSINFTNLNSNMVYYYNVTHIDKAGNPNSTETRKITLDSNPPSIILNYPVHNYNTSANLINFNWTATDNFPSNDITCNLTLDGTVNKSNISSSNGASTNYTISGLADNAHTWNITCWDSLNNTNTSETRSFTIVECPENLTAELVSDNVSVLINWSAKAYADSYSIYAKEDYTDEFVMIDSGITDLNWTDINAGSYATRFYKVVTVRGDANAISIITAGKQDVSLTYEDEAATDWNLLSIPFKLNNWELDNGTNNGYDFPVQPANCIGSLWKYNISNGWGKTDYENGHWIPATGSESFTSLEPGRGYWFEVNKSCTLTYVGIVPTDNMDIGLGMGWNVVGWYSTNSSTLPIGGSSAYPIIVNPADSVGAIDKYNPTSDSFEVTIHYDGWGWYPSGDNKDFTTLDPSIGYYFDVNQTAIWQHDPNT